MQSWIGKAWAVAAWGWGLAAGRVADLVQRLMPGRLPFSPEGIWINALQPHCDDSRTVSELGITSRDLQVTLADTVQWLADQGHLPAAGAAGGSSADRPRPEPRRRHLTMLLVALGAGRSFRQHLELASGTRSNGSQGAHAACRILAGYGQTEGNP